MYDDQPTYLLVAYEQILFGSDAHLQACSDDINFAPSGATRHPFLALDIGEGVPEMPGDHLWCLYAFKETRRGSL